MTTSIEDIKFPELIIGIVGAVGIDISQITASTIIALDQVEYKSKVVKITSEMYAHENMNGPAKDGSYYDVVTRKIEDANGARSRHEDPAFLARIAIRAIRRERQALTGDVEIIPPFGVAYIVHQLKRPEEVEILRQVYGKKFILISAYASEESRRDLIAKKIKLTSTSQMKPSQTRAQADGLVERDAEEGLAFGQRLRDTFHLADVFIDGAKKIVMEENLERFFSAFFGRNDIAPSKDEYGMYAAKSAALRSSDLSRQVGAAIFSPEGEIITQGCNEVPKAFGGTYWDTEEPDFRDIKIGSDPNELFRREILKDLFERLASGGFLSEKATKIGAPTKIAAELTKKSKIVAGKERAGGVLADAQIMDLTEFGRIVHAEMCAICDAARIGRSVKGATLFCTTFPCHNCTKHILASGVKKVVYMEPYPKSKAKELHENEIDIEKVTEGRVSFMPFLGISPFRYRDIFQKGKRKGPDGQAQRWMSGLPRPRIDMVAPLYIDVEAMALAPIVGSIAATTPKGDAESAG